MGWTLRGARWLPEEEGTISRCLSLLLEWCLSYISKDRVLVFHLMNKHCQGLLHAWVSNLCKTDTITDKYDCILADPFIECDLKFLDLKEEFRIRLDTKVDNDKCVMILNKGHYDWVCNEKMLAFLAQMMLVTGQ